MKFVRLVAFVIFLSLAISSIGWSAQNFDFTPIGLGKMEDTKFTKVNASHILVKTEKEAMDIRKQILDGASFEEMAEMYSLCPSGKQSGGNLGYFGKGVMVPEFEVAAFSLPVGDVSLPVQTGFGYHLIKVIDKK